MNKDQIFRIWLGIHNVFSYEYWLHAGKARRIPDDVEWGKPQEAAK